MFLTREEVLKNIKSFAVKYK